jgi:hypothetical protein
MSKGIIYINSSHSDLKYVKEAEASAKSFKRFIPDADYVLHTDATDFPTNVFDRIHPAEFHVPPQLADTAHMNGQMVTKLGVLAESPYDRTLYVGSDTYAFRSEVASMFDLLDRFDIVAAHAPFRINDAWGNSRIPEIPVCFPEFNCDLVLFRNTPPVMEFMEKWRTMYLEHAFGHPHDQGAFRYLAYFSDLRIATLPEEYNYRGKVRLTDTVVLQNRHLLPEYLNNPNNDLAGSMKHRAKVLYWNMYHRLFSRRR